MTKYVENSNYSYIGMTARPPYVVHYFDESGVQHESSFEDAPNWEYWDKLGEHEKNNILSKVAR